MGAAVDADGGGSVTGDGIGMMGGGGGAIATTIGEASLIIFLLVSIGSDFIRGGCDITGCGGGSAGVLIIGLICVDPTFIVGAFAGDCCIVLYMAAAFNIFAITDNRIIHTINNSFGNTMMYSGCISLKSIEFQHFFLQKFAEN